MSAIPTAPSLDWPATPGGALSIDEFCRAYSIGKTKAYSEAKSGRLQLRKVGSKTVIARVDAERWLHSLPTATVIEVRPLANAEPDSPHRDAAFQETR